jgi:hypothetical protein
MGVLMQLYPCLQASIFLDVLLKLSRSNTRIYKESACGDPYP